MINYNSALKVVNLGEPESSLILRKPRSPQGQGTPEASSPTGLTHVGGPRWESPEHPAYRAILDWIREAKAAAGGSAASLTLTADSYSPGYEPALAGDGDLSTIWQTEFVGASPGYPHELIVDLGAARRVEGLLYIPRQDGSNGRVRDFEIRDLGRRQDLVGAPRPRHLARRPDVQVCRPAWLHRPLRPAPRPERGERPPVMSAAEVAVDSSPMPDGGRVRHRDGLVLDTILRAGSLHISRRADAANLKCYLQEPPSCPCTGRGFSPRRPPSSIPTSRST